MTGLFVLGLTDKTNRTGLIEQVYLRLMSHRWGTSDRQNLLHITLAADLLPVSISVYYKLAKIVAHRVIAVFYIINVTVT